MPVFDGGHPNPNPPQIAVAPSPFPFGNVPQGVATTKALVIDNDGDLVLHVTSITFNNADWTVVGATNFNVPGGGTHSVTVQIFPTIAGADNANITVASNDPASPSVVITGTAFSVAVAGGVANVFPQPANAGSVKVGKVGSAPVLTIRNDGGVAFNVTGLTITAGSPTFSLQAPPATPFTLNPGALQTLIVLFSPTALGFQTGNLKIDTNLAAPQDHINVVLQGTGVLLIPFVVLTGLVNAFTIGFGDGTAVRLVQGNFNGTQDGTLVFNGVLWGAVVQEKTIQRWYVLYENVGVCSLTLTVKALRPTIGADSFDTISKTISIGTAAADGSIRSAFFDLQMSGEVLDVTLVRTGASGPCSLVAFVPEIDVKGEKVAGV